jgi:non-ribosomal peptide synthetase component F
LHTWNETSQAYPKDFLVYQAFAEQASKTPENIALVWKTDNGKDSMTYTELNTRGEALATYLRRLCVTSEVVVGLCVDQAKWMMVVGMLGIWKAGGMV